MHLGAFGLFLYNVSVDYPLAVKSFFILCMIIHSVEGAIGFYFSRCPSIF
jgi:hypothetical protein